MILYQVLRAFIGIRSRQNCCHLDAEMIVRGGRGVVAMEGSDLKPVVVGEEAIKEKESGIKCVDILDSKKEDR